MDDALVEQVQQEVARFGERGKSSCHGAQGLGVTGRRAAAVSEAG
jgi:hypothetical protein